MVDKFFSKEHIFSWFKIVYKKCSHNPKFFFSFHWFSCSSTLLFWGQTVSIPFLPAGVVYIQHWKIKYMYMYFVIFSEPRELQVLWEYKKQNEDWYSSNPCAKWERDSCVQVSIMWEDNQHSIRMALSCCTTYRTI